MPPGGFEHVNASGVCFYQLAAASLNFWVLKYVCLNHPQPVKAGGDGQGA